MWPVSIGGYDSNHDRHDEILEYRPDTEDWSLAGRMIQARGGHAASTINFRDVHAWCVIWMDWTVDS